MRNVLCVLFLFAASAGAALIQNGDFESGLNPNTTKPVGSTDVTGWVVVDNTIDWVVGIGSVIPVVGTNGPLYIDLNGFSLAPGGIEQTFATLSGMLYTVTFDMNANTTTGTAKSLEVSAGAQSQTFTYVPNAATTDPVWQGMTFQFTATGPSTTLAFRSLEPGTNFGPLIDNVNVVESVPEPSTVALVAIGLLAVGSQHRRVERKFRSTR